MNDRRKVDIAQVDLSHHGRLVLPFRHMPVLAPPNIRVVIRRVAPFRFISPRQFRFLQRLRCEDAHATLPPLPPLPPLLVRPVAIPPPARLPPLTPRAAVTAVTAVGVVVLGVMEKGFPAQFEDLPFPLPRIPPVFPFLPGQTESVRALLVDLGGVCLGGVYLGVYSGVYRVC